MGAGVEVFFYGSYMNRSVLAEVDYSPEPFEVGRLGGFDIRIEPRANLVRSEHSSVYGVLTTATHEELTRLYQHAHDVLGETYLPRAVAIATANGYWRPALAYICPEMKPGPADEAYVDRILGPARSLGFPRWYVARLESFAPKRSPDAADVQVFRVLIRTGEESLMREWVTGLKGREHTYDALREEGILVESLFIEERDGRMFLWVYQRIADANRANQVFQESTNPVNEELRGLMERAWEKVDFFPLSLDYGGDRASAGQNR